MIPMHGAVWKLCVTGQQWSGEGQKDLADLDGVRYEGLSCLLVWCGLQSEVVWTSVLVHLFALGESLGK